MHTEQPVYTSKYNNIQSADREKPGVFIHADWRILKRQKDTLEDSGIKIESSDLPEG